MYLVFIRMPGERCHRRLRSLKLCSLADLLSSSNYLPCLLIQHRRSGPRSVSDWTVYTVVNAVK